MVKSIQITKDDDYNFFVKNNEIPLGINTFRGNKHDKKNIVTIPYKKNGSVVLIAGSGWGKSVLLKRLIDYELGLFKKKRAGLIIDTQGVDHRLLARPNLKYKPLFKNYGETPLNITNIKNYCPVFAQNLSNYGDIIWGISLNDLDSSDIMSSNLSIQSITEFFKIKQLSPHNRQLMDDPNDFYRQFLRIKSAKSENDTSDLDYEEGTLINYGLKMSMLNTFSWWAGYEPDDDEKRPYETKEEFEIKKRSPYFVSVKDPRYMPTFRKDWENNRVVVNNFMEANREREAMSIYGGYLLRNAYNYCRLKKHNLGKLFGGMLVVVEESNMFIDDNERKGCNYYFTEMLCRGFKFEVKIIANFQSISGINRDIREHLTSGTNPVIVGKITMSDREFLSSIFPDVKSLHLRSNKNIDGLNWGANEWAIYYNDSDYDTFVPYPSLSKIHERG